MSDSQVTHDLTSASSRARARRERIIAAARSLFAQHGFDRTGMAQIARESQVLVGQIYRDFASKEDLIAAIVERDISGLLDDPELAAVEAGQTEQLDQWVRRFVARGLDDDMRKILSDILSEGTRNPRIASILTQIHEQLHRRITHAALIWLPQPERSAERALLADLILTLTGAIHHRQILGLGVDRAISTRVVAIVEAEIDRMKANAF